MIMFFTVPNWNLPQKTSKTTSYLGYWFGLPDWFTKCTKKKQTRI